MRALARARAHTHTHTHTHTLHPTPVIPSLPLAPPSLALAAVPAAHARAPAQPSLPRGLRRAPPSGVTYPARSAQQTGDGDCSQVKGPQDKPKKRRRAVSLLPTIRGSAAPHALGGSAAVVSEETHGGRRSCGWRGKLWVFPPRRPRLDRLLSPVQP